MNVVDSSGWLEYFAGGENAGFFAGPLADSRRLMVPTIILLEVFRHVLRHRGEDDALTVAAQMGQGRVVDLDATTALEAARIGVELKLPLAGSVVLATARIHEAVLWTQDADFRGIRGVHYRVSGISSMSGFL